MAALTFSPDYVVKPGETLAETIAALGMRKAEFARHMGIDPAHLYKLISAAKPITPDIALKLERVTHTPASFWSALENNYRSALMRRRELDRKELDWLRMHPVREMIQRGWIVDGGQHGRYASLLAYYRVASPEAWEQVWSRPLASARISPKYGVKEAAVAAWLRAGEIEARKRTCGQYSAAALREAVAVLRQLVGKPFGQAVLLEAQVILSRAGVALVFVKGLKGAPLNGATLWSDGLPIVILTLRTGGADRIWFALFHELYHVLRERKSGHLALGAAWEASEDEQMAERYAADILLPATFDSEVMALRTAGEMDAFAARHGLSRSVVAGRLQYLTKDYRHCSNLIEKFKWPDNQYVF